MIDYFLIGLKSMMKSSVLTFAIYFISFLLLLILWRRYVIVRQSGGNFFAPFHISKGRFYIHNAYVFRKFLNFFRTPLGLTRGNNSGN